MPTDISQPKVPRGRRIREKSESESDSESKSHPMPLPLFIFLLILAGLLDVFGAIPILGTVLNALLGPIIWLTYYFVGAKGTSAAIRLVLVFAMSSAFVLELIPFVGTLPINIVVAFAVYILLDPRFSGIVARAKAAIGKVVSKVARVHKGVKAAGRALKVAEKLIQQTT